jgi:hypothetical protein
MHGWRTGVNVVQHQGIHSTAPVWAFRQLNVRYQGRSLFGIAHWKSGASVLLALLLAVHVVHALSASPG